jgi:sarcosine oxidase, subunit beta
MSASTFDAVVIGGGLHGLSAALHLARRKQRVVVLERSWVGRHASGATAAGVRTLMRDPAEVPLSLEAMAMWHGIEKLVGDDCGFHAHGQLRVAEREADLPVLERRAALMRSLNYAHEELIDRAELRRLVPALSPHCVGALVSRRDGAADPHRTLEAFRRSAETAGVEIREGFGVTGIERRDQGWLVRTRDQDFAASAVVNAAGAWADRIARLVGDDIPLGTKASMMIVTERIGPLVEPVVSAVGRSLSFKQTGQGGLLIGGGLQGRPDLEAGHATPNLEVLAKGARAAAELFPCVRGVCIARIWAGLEAKTEDLLPVIGKSPNAPRFFHAFGFSGHGFQLVPAVGAAIADLVVRGETTRPIAPFRAERLMGRRAAA